MNKVVKYALIVLGVIAVIALGVFLYIHFFIKHVVYKDDDGKVLSELKIHKGKVLTLPTEPTKHNCEFLGWTVNGENYDFNTKIKDDLTLTANWKYFYDVKFLDTDETELFEQQKIEKGNKITEPEKPYKKAHDFLGWTENNEEYDFETQVKKDTTLIASWREYVKYDLPVYGFHCAIKKAEGNGIYSYNDITKVYKGLEFICYIGAEIRGSEHYFEKIMYELEYGSGFELIKAKDLAKVENNVRTITLERPDAMYDGIEYTFKVVDASKAENLYVGIKDFKFTATDDKFYSADDRLITDLTTNP